MLTKAELLGAEKEKTTVSEAKLAPVVGENSQTDEFELRNRHSKFAAVRQFACKFGYIVYIYVLSYICKFKCSSAIYIIV